MHAPARQPPELASRTRGDWGAGEQQALSPREREQAQLQPLWQAPFLLLAAFSELVLVYV